MKRLDWGNLNKIFQQAKEGATNLISDSDDELEFPMDQPVIQKTLSQVNYENPNNSISRQQRDNFFNRGCLVKLQSLKEEELEEPFQHRLKKTQSVTQAAMQQEMDIERNLF